MCNLVHFKNIFLKPGIHSTLSITSKELDDNFKKTLELIIGMMKSLLHF